MAYIGPGGVQLALDVLSAGLLVVVIVVTCGGVAMAVARRWRPAVILSLVGIATATTLSYRAVMAPAQSWPIMLAGLDEASGAERLLRVQEVRDAYHLGEMRAVDWLRLSHRWNVCHLMWKQDECRLPAGPYEAQGIAREDLASIR
jgi:hypothetical protein